ncbi:MAG: hypothetical protein OJI67_17325, partial [Prosthecobacter sp.]|nr:hypothetical protein [Prosthecobacter sp.]
INLGLPGFGARRKDLVVQQALKYEPNLIILHVGASNEYEDEREWRRRDDFNSPHPKNWLMRSLVLRQFYEMKTEKLYWQWLPLKVRNQTGDLDVDAELRASADEAMLQKWKTLVKEVTQQSVQRIQSAHIPSIIVTQASKKKDAAGEFFLDDSAVDDWTAGLVSADVARVPMKGVIAPSQIAAIYSDTNHVRLEGHRLIAQAIIRTLQEKGWLPQAAQK